MNIDPIWELRARRWMGTELPDDDDSGFFRRAEKIPDPPSPDDDPLITPEQARIQIYDKVSAYRAMPNPDHVLLVSAPAGVGKTFTLRTVCETFVLAGDFVAWFMPTHQMARDLIASSKHPGLFYEWQPRRPAGADGQGETCKHAAAIAAFMERGYPAIDFCSHVDGCGWDFIKYGCVYHGQSRELKAQGARILVVQHQHLFVGHPMWGDVSFVVGDESPLHAVPQVRRVPSGAVLPKDPSGLPEKLRDLLERLAALAASGQRLFGSTLLGALGGPAAVFEAVKGVPEPEAATPWYTPPRRPEQVYLMDHYHLPATASEMRREARALLEGVEPEPRIFVEDGDLVVLRRHDPVWRYPDDPRGAGWPRHVVWMDATADRRFYELLFRRPVEVFSPRVTTHHRIYQVKDRANGIGSLTVGRERDGRTPG